MFSGVYVTIEVLPGAMYNVIDRRSNRVAGCYPLDRANKEAQELDLLISRRERHKAEYGYYPTFNQ